MSRNDNVTIDLNDLVLKTQQYQGFKKYI